MATVPGRPSAFRPESRYRPAGDGGVSSKTPRFRLALFDFDGTLADSEDWFVEAMNASAERFGYRTVSKEELETLRGLGNREIVRRMGVPAWRMPAIARHFRSEAARNLHRIHPFPGAVDMLRALHEDGVRLAIVSSNSEANIRAVLGPEAASLISDFACESSLFGKAAKLRRVVRASEIPAQDAIAIGDETRDIEAARKAGVAAGAVTWGYATRAALEGSAPDFIFEDFAELVRAVAAS